MGGRVPSQQNPPQRHAPLKLTMAQTDPETGKAIAEHYFIISPDPIEVPSGVRVSWVTFREDIAPFDRYHWAG